MLKNESPNTFSTKDENSLGTLAQEAGSRLFKIYFSKKNLEIKRNFSLSEPFFKNDGFLRQRII